MKKTIIAALLIFLAILFRTLWHLAPNVEFITTVTFLAGRYLGRRFTLIVPFASILISDLILGNTNIHWFTWSAFIVIGLFAGLLSTSSKHSSILATTGMGVISGLWFYVWTNFGVWATDSWGMYPRTLQGLIQCYVMGLPFLKYTLLGNVVFIPITFGMVQLAQKVISASSWRFKLAR